MKTIVVERASKFNVLEQEFNVFSPDGFTIDFDTTYKGIEEAKKALKLWMTRYETQGYYSSNKGRITLDELQDYCEIIPVA